LFGYEVLFDVADEQAREAAKTVRSGITTVQKVIKTEFSGAEHGVEVRVVSIGTPAEAQVCGRPGQPPPKDHIDVSDVPIEKPDSNVPLVQRDQYWLTPIEVPFYDALRETSLVFAVQPWIQGVESRFRLDFLVFYDGGMVAVELDGHETHKTKEQRTRDAKRTAGLPRARYGRSAGRVLRSPATHRSAFANCSRSSEDGRLAPDVCRKLRRGYADERFRPCGCVNPRNRIGDVAMTPADFEPATPTAAKWTRRADPARRAIPFYGALTSIDPLAPTAGASNFQAGCPCNGEQC
jgi:hypothetical protein